MPVSNDSAKVSVDFIYEWETAGGDIVRFGMRFQHNEDGPIILISAEGEEEPIQLPALMFSEVSEFLVRQGAIRGISSPIVVGGRSVAMPSITRKAKEGPAPRKIGQRMPKPDSIPDEPVATFTPTQDEEADEGAEPETETEEMTTDTAAGIRDAMRNRAQVNLERMKEKKVKPK